MSDIYAVWTYDIFPYALVSKIDPERSRPEHLPPSHVYVPAYQGWVAPITLLIGAAGEQVKKELDRLQREYRQEKENLERKHRETLVRRLKYFGVVHPKIKEE